MSTTKLTLLLAAIAQLIAALRSDGRSLPAVAVSTGRPVMGRR